MVGWKARRPCEFCVIDCLSGDLLSAMTDGLTTASVVSPTLISCSYGPRKPMTVFGLIDVYCRFVSTFLRYLILLSISRFFRRSIGGKKF